jgi:hypothetical protein
MLVKRDLAEGRLAQRSGTPPRAPASLAGVLTAATQAWREEVERVGYPVHGRLDDLSPVLGGAADPHPDDVPSGVPDPGEVAELVASVLGRAEAWSAGQQTDQPDELRVDSSHDGDAGTGDVAGPARPAGPVERLRRRLQLHRD